MKNKQINKFLLMFFLSFTFFFSLSYAIIEKDTAYTVSTVSSYGSFYETLGSYSNTDVSVAIKNYVAGTDTQTLVTIMNDLKTQNVINGKWMVIDYPSQKYSYLLAFSATSSFSNCDFVYYTGQSFPLYFLRSDVAQPFSVITIHSAGGKFRDYNVTSTDSGQVFAFNQARTLVSASSSVYSGSISNNKWSWDGTYIHEVSQPDEPDIPSMDYDLANLLSIIKNSTEIQDNIYPYLEEYFIIPNGNAGNEQVFSVYFYYPSVNLSQFEYSYNDMLYYDLDKTSIDGVISNLTYYLGGNTSSNVVKDVQLATLYYNPDTGTGDVYFTGNRTFDQLKAFESKKQPIIYTTKDIAYYSATWGETDTEWTAIPDTTKDILSSEITDSEGNIVDPVLPGSSSVLLGDTPFERFVNVIQNAFLGLIDSISKGLISFTDYLLQIFGENVVTFAFLIIIKAITVLVSSVALVFRFVSFILTLVSIPSTSALFVVDVATNANGLVFTGLNWGTHFIKGLNFIKTIKWNGLGLWTLFEVFVASLEVVLFVKIVRKHYRTL